MNYSKRIYSRFKPLPESFGELILKWVEICEKAHKFISEFETLKLNISTEELSKTNADIFFQLNRSYKHAYKGSIAAKKYWAECPGVVLEENYDTFLSGFLEQYPDRKEQDFICTVLDHIENSCIERREVIRYFLGKEHNKLYFSALNKKYTFLNKKLQQIGYFINKEYEFDTSDNVIYHYHKPIRRSDTPVKKPERKKDKFTANQIVLLLNSNDLSVLNHLENGGYNQTKTAKLLSDITGKSLQNLRKYIGLLNKPPSELSGYYQDDQKKIEDYLKKEL